MKPRTPAELVLALYLALTLPLYFVVGDYSLGVWGMYAAHVLGLIYFVSGYRLWFRSGAESHWLRDLLPLVVCVLLYSEVAWLNRAFYPDRYLDPSIMALEVKIFRCHPAMDLRRALPWPWLSEYLHLGYFAYYLLAPMMVLGVLACAGRRALRIAASTVVLVFVLGFVVFIVFPVAGPYYEYPRMTVSGFFPAVARWVVDKGSAVGTAFPSSHVSISVTMWIMTLRYAGRVGLVMALIVPALALGAIYGGFHYAVDVMAGACLGLAGSFWGHAWVAHRVS